MVLKIKANLLIYFLTYYWYINSLAFTQQHNLLSTQIWCPLYFKIKIDSHTGYVNISFLYLISIPWLSISRCMGKSLIREGFNWSGLSNSLSDLHFCSQSVYNFFDNNSSKTLLFDYYLAIFFTDLPNYYKM